MSIVDGKTLIGWGVVREEPWHFVGLYQTQVEAAAVAIDMGVGYTTRYGESHDANSFVFEIVRP